MEKINYAYFGTPEFSTFVLEELISAGYPPVCVITTPDRAAGRGMELSEPPMKKFALKHGVEVLQPEKFDETFLHQLKEKKLDLIIVAAFGRILPSSLLSITKYSPLNVHPSLLPMYRGTSPVESQILADEKNIGVTIIRMDEEMDHGPIVAQEQVEIPQWPISRNQLNEILWRKGGKTLAHILDSWIKGGLEEKIQNHENATFTRKIKKEDGLIDLSESGRKNFLKYLAYEGWPGVYFFKDGIRMKVTKAKYENNSFIIERVIPEGKKEIDFNILK